MLSQPLSAGLLLMSLVNLFLTGSLTLVCAQNTPGTMPYSGATKAANPPVPKYVRRSGNPLSPEEKKHADFKQAIEAGNAARNKSDYVTAFANYRHASELFPNDAGSYYGLGNVYFDVYCYASAIDFYSRATKFKPNYVDALMQLGYAYIKLEQYDNAETQFAAVVQANPKNTNAKLARFYVWARKGRYEEAIDRINQLINETPAGSKDRASAYIVLGDVYVAQNKWQESIDPFEQVTRLNPDLAEGFLKLGMSQLVVAFSNEPIPMEVTIEDKALLTASARQATDTLRTAVDVKHFEHPVGNLLLGMALMYQGNYRGAADKINAYLGKVKEVENQLQKLDSNLKQKCDYAFGRLYANGHIQLGLVYEREASNAGPLKDKLLNDAIEQYQNAIAAKQDNAGGYSALGNLYLGQSKYQEAIDQFEKALLYESSSFTKASLYTGLGTAYSRLGSDNKALDYLNKSIAIDPNPTAYFSLAQAYRRLGNFDEAIRLGNKALALERTPRASTYHGLALTYFLRAQTNHKDADYEEAIRLLNEATKINKTFVELYVALGSIYKFYKDGARVDQALANLEKAKDYDPQNPSIYFHLGDIHSSITHNYDAAIKYYSEAIRLKPDYVLAHWSLALAYREKKEYSEAIRQFLEGLKYHKNLDAYVMLADTYDRQKNYAEAIKVLQEAVTFDPESHSAYLHLARVYTHQQNNDEAIRYYELAISRLKPDDTSNRDLYRCRITRLQRRYTEALDCFQKLTYPLQDQVPYEIGATYVLMGNKEAALAQHVQLTRLQSTLADELMKQINEMKPGN